MSKVKEIRPERVFVKLADGEEYDLVFDFEAFAAVEEKYGSLDNAMKAMDSGALTAFRVLLWAGLQQNYADKFYQPRALQGLMRMADLLSYMEALTRAIQASLPAIPEDAPGDEKNA